MGRNTFFNDELSAQIIELYKQGKTDKQVSNIIGVSIRALQYWKTKHPSFLHSIKEAKSIPNQIVESCLYARATGYTITEEKIVFGTLYKVKKHYPPDVTAAIFWLTNRDPERWRRSASPEPDAPKQIDNTKKSFLEFCRAASYPDPFPKQNEMREFVINETEPRLLLGSRGYGKTDYGPIMGIAYDIYLNRESTTLIMTKSKERNAAMLKEIENACIANGMTFEKANSQCLRVAGLHGKDHSVSAVTIKTASLRGRHPKRVILDDPVTEDDTSDATRKLVEKKYYEIHKLCPNVCIIGQPAHKYDLYAKLRPLLKKMEVPHGTIPELDHDLEAQRLAGVSEASIQASYHLKILNEGATPFDNVKYMDKYPTSDSAIAFIDPSHEGGDYTAISVIKSHMQGIAVVGFVWQKAWNHCLDDIAKVVAKYNVKRLGFETNALGDMPIDILRQTFPSCGVVGRRSNNNKHSRIMAAGTYAHLIHLCRESSPTYIDHVVQYEYNADYDDAPDSLATGLEWIGLIRGKI
jgi:hypothetical protein